MTGSQLSSLHGAALMRAACSRFRKAVMTEITKITSTLIVLSGLPGSGKSVLAESCKSPARCRSRDVLDDRIEAAIRRAGLDKTETGVAAYDVAQALADEHLRLGAFRHCRRSEPGRGAARRMAQSGGETSRRPQGHRMRLLR